MTTPSAARHRPIAMPQRDNNYKLQQLCSQVAALEQLLEVYERSVCEQSARLESALKETAQRADALRESEARFKTLVEHAPEAIVLLDVDAGRFVDANDNALRLYGLSREELLARHPAEVSPPTQPDGRPSMESAREKIEAALHGSRPVFDWMHCNARGMPIPCEVRLVRLPATGKKLVRASVTDISARKRAEQELMQARDAAEAASRAKSSFLASMSHEIRTPLSAVIGLTELVLGTQLTDTQREYLEMVKDSGESLLGIISDMLDFSKIEAGKLELVPADFKLREQLEKAIKPLAARAREKGVDLVWKVAANVPDRLTGDFDRLRQVLVNLVGNAVKFTDEGRVALDVDRESQNQGDVVLRFTVTDTGIGIPQEKLAHIFEAFEQADKSLTRRHTGTGLGLAISSRLVDLFGGCITVESEPGTGSRFGFTARLQLQHEAPRRPMETQAPTEGPLPIRPLKVLLAEDSATNQRLTVGILSEWGHDVTVAADGREAVRQFEQHDFDLVLMDVQMPEMDGLQVTAAIREQEQTTGRRVPIIAMTAHAMSEDRARCLAAGMDGYVAKPIDQQALREAIAAASNGNHAASSAK